jgi:LSM domain
MSLGLSGLCSCACTMLFYSYFKTLVGKKVGRNAAAPLLLHGISHRCHRATVVMRLGTGLLPCDRCPHHMQVTVELKNDLAISGTLHSVDQYLNIKLHNTQARCFHSLKRRARVAKLQRFGL